jgi:NADH:ubiquinone oxidoreductase subunit 6 (subunit J)
VNRRAILAIAGVGALFVVMGASFVGIPWPTQSHFVPVTGNGTANSTANSLSGSLFDRYPIAVILIALILAASMIGGVYLAKMEGGEIGP